MSDNSIRYEIWLDDPRGVRITLLDKIVTATFQRNANAESAFELVMPSDFDEGMIKLDNIIEFWRAPAGGTLVLENVYFLRRWRFFDGENGDEYISLSGVDAKDLLRRRIVAYYAAAAKANMTDQADDMLKAIVTDNLGADSALDYDGAAETGRDLSALNFAIDVDLSACASITRSFAWRNVLEICTELVNDSSQQGTRLYYEVTPTSQSDGTLGFRLLTYIGQIGKDRSWDSGSSALFGKAYGNLANPSYEEDYSEEINFIYAGGEGVEDGRNIQEVSDSTRYNLSPWNRCEGFTDARNEDTDAGVQARGRADLEAGKPIKTFSGTLLDSPQNRYGLDWSYGDLVTCEYRKRQFDGVVDQVEILINSDGSETLSAGVEIV